MVSSHVKCLFSYVQLVINYGEGGGGVELQNRMGGGRFYPNKKGGGGGKRFRHADRRGGGHKLI